MSILKQVFHIKKGKTRLILGGKKKKKAYLALHNEKKIKTKRLRARRFDAKSQGWNYLLGEQSGLSAVNFYNHHNSFIPQVMFPPFFGSAVLTLDQCEMVTRTEEWDLAVFSSSPGLQRLLCFACCQKCTRCHQPAV